MTQPTSSAHARALLDLLRQYRHSQVLIACVNLGVFRALAGNSVNAASLADQLDVQPGALERLLNSAVALGLLERAGQTYRNSPAAAETLVDESSGYMGHLFEREPAFYERWGHLTEAVRRGGRPEPSRQVEERPGWVRGFIYSLYDFARLYGPSIADALKLDPDQTWRVLDVGGGHGGYSIALARAYPKLHATVLDLPSPIEIAREIVAATEVAARVELRAGDFMEVELGEDYDLALLFGVLVSEPAERRRFLLRRVHDVLKPGGRLALREFSLNEDGSGELDALLFDLQMLLSTESGGALKRETLVAELAEAGFGTVEEIAVPGASHLWVATRR